MLVDDEHNLPVLQDLNRIAFISNFTLIYTWSNQEAARYLETWKAFEQKSSVSIQAKEETEFLPRLSRVLTSVRSVNKTDVTTLLDVFGNFTNICHAEDQQLILCPGMGEKKVKRLFQALHVSFQPKASSMQKKNKLSATYEHAKQQASKLKEDVVEEEVVELNEEVEEVDGERESKRSRIITAIDLIEDNEEDKLDQK